MLISIVLLAGIPSGKPVPHYEKTQQVVNLVEKAAALLHKEGEKAFDAFRRKGSPWFHGDVYVVVDDLKGNCLCNPATPKLEGKNYLNLKDADGKSFIRMMVRKVTGKNGAGWVHFLWPKPGHEKPSWKSSYVMWVKDDSGREYMVGSGIYDAKIDKVFLIDSVDDAAALVEKKGGKAFGTLRSKAGPYRYQDVYVFIHDGKGLELVVPPFPEIEGKNYWDFKDAAGKLVIQENIKMLKNKDAGWIEYLWPKPGEKKPSKKDSYVRKIKVDGKVLYVGAGAYFD